MLQIVDPTEAAFHHYQAGRFDLARDLCAQILKNDPGQAGAWHLVGLVAFQARDYVLAQKCVEKALVLAPVQAMVLSNMGQIQHAQDQLEEAIDSFRQALGVDPDCAETHARLGAVLFKTNDLAEAQSAYEQAVLLQPDNPRWHINLGNLLATKKHWAEAIAHFREALRLEPNLPEAHHQLGLAYQETGRLDLAESSYHEALRLKPTSTATYNNLANVWRLCGRLDEALRALNHTLRVRPDDVDALMNRGLTWVALNTHANACRDFRAALQIDKAHVGACMHLGNSLTSLLQLAKAEAVLRQAMRLAPDNATAHQYLASNLFAQGRIEEACVLVRKALGLGGESNATLSSLLFMLHYDPAPTPAEILDEHKRWASQFATLPPPWPHANIPNPDRPLRIGYVSGDLRQHVVAFFFEPIMANHDSNQFEVFCYAEVANPDPVTYRFKNLASHWLFTCGMSDDQLAEKIREDGIDILVDLVGHTAYNRLLTFARKPAPVQVTYLGYQHTTGLPAMDYRLTDALSEPPGSADHYVEKLAYLDEGWYCYQVNTEAPDVGPLPALKKGYLTFGSPHNLAKLNRGVLDLWARVLVAVPTAHLYLLRQGLRGPVAERVRRHLTDQGVEPERVDIINFKGGFIDYLHHYNNIDICLDAFPGNAGTTACDALSMGVPWIALPGERFYSRVTKGIMTRLGLAEEFVAESPEEYVACAVRWSERLEDLAALRSRLRPLFREKLGDGPRFTRAVEKAYRTIWRRWCDQQNQVQDYVANVSF